MKLNFLLIILKNFLLIILNFVQFLHNFLNIQIFHFIVIKFEIKILCIFLITLSALDFSFPFFLNFILIMIFYYLIRIKKIFLINLSALYFFLPYFLDFILIIIFSVFIQNFLIQTLTFFLKFLTINYLIFLFLY